MLDTFGIVLDTTKKSGTMKFGLTYFNIFCSVQCRRNVTFFSMGDVLTSCLTLSDRTTTFQRQEINLINWIIPFSFNQIEHKLSCVQFIYSSIYLNNAIKRHRVKGIHVFYTAASGLCSPLILKYNKPGQLFRVSNCNQVDANSLPNNKLICVGMIHLLPLPIMVIEYSSHNKCS